jgi:hypothetical protein
VLKAAPPLPRLAATGDSIACPEGQCPYQSCHCAALDTDPQWNQSATGCAEDHLHCIWTCAPAGATDANGMVVRCATAIDSSF